jgi:hypothetical protein
MSSANAGASEMSGPEGKADLVAALLEVRE